jgi:hypothetical protein
MARTLDMTNSLFKELYVDIADHSLVNKKTPLASILMKNKRVDFVGSNFIAPVRFGSAVGLGYRASGQNLPQAGAAPRGQATFPAVRAYATAEYEREAIVASRNDKGAFAKATVSENEAVIEGFNLHNIERALFSDGSGKLGEIASQDSGAGTAADPYVVTMATTGTNGPKYKKQYFPRGARLDCYSAAGVYQLTCKVVAALASTLKLEVVSVGADSAFAATDVLYWEGNKDIECVGLKKIAPTSAGTLYGISQTTNPEFMGVVSNMSGNTLAYADINDHVADMEAELGESFDMVVGSFATLAGLKSQAEDQKRYSSADVKSSDGKIGFKGLEILSGEGPVPLIASQMCQDDELWFINTKYLQMVLRQDFGWFDDDGSILMRDQNKDMYNARYGGYFELFCSKPNSVGRLRNFVL